MAERPAVNASPLIYLSRAGLMDLLRVAGDEVVVPEAVANEILQRGASDITAQAIHSTDWLTIVETPIVPEEIQAWGLGAGESSVLAWAYTNAGTEAIIDDLAARRCAAALNLLVRGTLGLVLIAKRRGLITEARTTMMQLRQAGMYLSDRVMNQALSLVGE